MVAIQTEVRRGGGGSSRGQRHRQGVTCGQIRAAGDGGIKRVVTSAARTASPPAAETDFPRAGISGWWVRAASVRPRVVEAWRCRLLPQRVVIKGSVARIHEQLQQRVRVGMLGAGAHLDWKQEQAKERQGTEHATDPGGIAGESRGGRWSMMRRVGHLHYRGRHAPRSG